MGKKRLKIAKGLGDFVPVSVNFSQIRSEFEDNGLEFDPGDDGLQTKRLEANLEYEEMIVQILCNLDLREKLIFVYQLLRDGGYQIDHGAFAKTVPISRRQYMRALDDVRIKSLLYIIGYKKGFGDDNGHKGE